MVYGLRMVGGGGGGGGAWKCLRTCRWALEGGTACTVAMGCEWRRSEGRLG